MLAASLMGTMQLHAGASNKNGNPYGNGTFFQTTGTFSAVVRGQNLSGTVMFSTGTSTNTNSPGSGGSSVIVFQGNTYQGNSSGFWDPSSGAINGQIWGGQALSGTNSYLFYPEAYNTNYFPVVVPVLTNIVTTYSLTTTITNADGTVTTSTLPTQTNTLSTNYVILSPVGSNNVSDSVYMNGYFGGQTANNYPNQSFSATGSITQQQLTQTPTANTNSALIDAGMIEGTVPPSVSSINIPITVQGVRVSDSYASFTAVSNTVPYSTSYYSTTNPPQ
jgi:hypothetical protein